MVIPANSSVNNLGGLETSANAILFLLVNIMDET
jgi:hypothetical protein